MSSTQAAEDGYFNDLSRQPSVPNSGTQTVPTVNGQSGHGDSHELPKPKRVACAICRKRKLKCDGGRPKCGTCARLGHNCAYDEVRRKSGPKRGYVKELEARLAQVETQLKTKSKEKKAPTPTDSNRSQDPPIRSPPSDHVFANVHTEGDPMQGMAMPGPVLDYFDDMTIPNAGSTSQNIIPDLSQASPFDDGMTWEMVGLGLEEPLPTQEAIDELHEIYFRTVHPSMPLIHPYRYRAAMGLAPHMRPPVSLRYAVWALAANMSTKYQSHKEIFYRRSRRYAELDEMKSLGEAFVTVAHCQTWILMATFEFQHMYFPRAWSSVGRAVRLAMMIGLNRLDGIGLDVKQVLPPPRDWTDREERRRTFWMAYCVDRYASMGTGWPLAVDERDIMTNLPAYEENYERSIPQDTVPLPDCMTPGGASSLSPFAGVVFIAHLFGRNLTHLHRPESNDEDDNLQGEFWKRHRQLDNTLSKTSLMLPAHLRLPTGVRDPNIIFINMNIHTTIICLHQAAIYKLEQNKLQQSLIDQSSARCLLAATEIANIMRMISHLDCMGMNPFLAFSLYVAARVFIHVIKKCPGENELRTSLEFLILAMQQFKKINPLSDSFLIQLSLDLQGTGMDFLLQNPTHSMSTMAKMDVISKFESSYGCSPLVEIQGETKKQMHPLYPLPTLQTTHLNQSPSLPGGEPPTRPTQYSMQSFELPTRDSPRPTPQLRNIERPVPGFINRILGDDWRCGGPTGMDPRANPYDTDTSGGQTSSGLSPGHSSSNTSCSPPSQEEDSGSTGLNSTAYQPAAPAAEQQPKVFHFTNVANFIGLGRMPNQPQQFQADLKSSSAWSFDSAAASSAPANNITTGMTPSSDGDWSQLMDPMNWDSSVLGADPTQWSPSNAPMN
ncbi:MAG: hypothetical protein Q9181_005724 [Wetmoreana brouardii]